MAKLPKKKPVSKKRPAKKKKMTAAEASAAKNANLAKAREAAAAKREEAAKIKEAATAKTLDSLQTVAKEINSRYAKASNMDSKADNHRIAASIRMVQASDELKGTGVTFKDWVADNIVDPGGDGAMSLSKANKLLAIGRSDNPLEKIHADRDGSMIASAKARKKLAAPKKRPQKKEQFNIAEEAVSVLSDKVQVTLAETVAAQHGLKLVNPDDVPAAAPARKPKGKNATERAKNLLLDQMKDFELLTAPNKLKMLEYCALNCGYTIEKLEDDELPAIPKALRRTGKKAPSRRKAA